MSSLRVAVLGGGPAGLTAARLLRLRHPTWEVTVFERQTPAGSFGYGVGLGWSALRQLAAVDQHVVGQLHEASVSVDTWTIRRDDETISAANTHGLGIARRTLLEVLRRNAEAVGVRFQVGQHATLDQVANADVVVAADGSSSETRQALGAQLGATASLGELAYIWCGADIRLPAMTLALARTSHGPLAAHVMPYSSTSSTFQVDTHSSTLQEQDADRDRGLRWLEETYTDVLGGASLRAKKVSWQCFSTVRCETWAAGNVVLLGDAAHTAHYTVGSGTGLAIEDAVVLAESLGGEADVSSAFATYQAIRRPRAEKIQQRAARSETWWTSLALRVDDPLPQLILGYLTRTGAISLAALVDGNRDLIHTAVPGLSLTADPAHDILAMPRCGRSSSVVSSEHLTGDEVATVVLDKQPDLARIRREVDRASDLRARGTTTVRLVGPADDESLLDRLDLAEQLRRRSQMVTVVAATANQRESLAVGLLAGRTDLVELS